MSVVTAVYINCDFIAQITELHMFVWFVEAVFSLPFTS